MKKLLIVDDHPDILDANVSYFTNNGFETLSCETGRQAIEIANSNKLDCIILDVMLPDMDGVAVCGELRRYTDAPVIFLSCLDQLDDKVRGLMAGGDDYMTKPYELLELYARVTAAIRRGEKNAPPPENTFYLDTEKRIIHTPNEVAMLSQKEFALLKLLYDNPGKKFAKQALITALWPDGQVDENTLQTHIKNLRRKIQFAEAYVGRIVSDYGSGYHLEI